MVRAWYMDDVKTDPRQPHKTVPERPVNLEQLKERTGIEYHYIEASDADGSYDEVALGKLRDARGYSYHDVIDISRDTLPNYDEKVTNFVTEHIHADEEIRYVLRGSGYYDVRDVTDAWIRVLMEAGDLIILPAGIYHRFTLDTKNYMKAIRLFVGEPVWTPHYRPADTHPARLDYVKQYIAVSSS